MHEKLTSKRADDVTSSVTHKFVHELWPVAATPKIPQSQVNAEVWFVSSLGPSVAPVSDFTILLL